MKLFIIINLLLALCLCVTVQGQGSNGGCRGLNKRSLRNRLLEKDGVDIACKRR